jgi:hypothetical protein
MARRSSRRSRHSFIPSTSIPNISRLPDVQLIDDGSLDTVVSVNGEEIRYDQEFGSQFRDRKTGGITRSGWKKLKEQAIEDYDNMFGDGK